MKRFARLELDDRPCYVQLEEDGAEILDRAPWLGGTRTGQRIESVDALGRGAGRRLAPVQPSKIVCIGRNYAAHARELGNDVPTLPLLFLKPPSALLGPDGVIELPAASERVEHEVELGLVIGQRVRRADMQRARAAIWGHTIVCDVTARDLQRADKTWARGKGFDTFCPVGPVVVADLDDAALGICCSVNGELRQDGCTDAMVHRPDALVAYISQIMTLEPGDLVATGTPAGVGPLEAGDNMQLTIDGIGALDITVSA